MSLIPRFGKTGDSGFAKSSHSKLSSAGEQTAPKTAHKTIY